MKLTLIKAIFLLIGCSSTVYGQIDSLKALLSDREGLERADILGQLAYEYIDVDLHVSLAYGAEGFGIAMQCHDSLRIVSNGLPYASALRRLGYLDAAIANLQINRSNRPSENLTAIAYCAQ